jgi:hypothetical protein
MLSKENYDSLDENSLYKKPPVIDNSFSVGTTPGTYHCKNWTFRVSKNDGRAFMRDTYFDDVYEEVSDKNIKDYIKIFDFREVKKIDDREHDEYEEKDLFIVATNSGGYSCGNLGWVKKEAKKSQELLIKKFEEEISSLQKRLVWKKEELEKAISGEHYYLK